MFEFGTAPISTEEDSDVAEDVVAARILSSLANSLDGENDFSLTFDASSMNGLGRMLVLDLQIWIECN